jgi:hypothetical protein
LARLGRLHQGIGVTTANGNNSSIVRIFEKECCDTRHPSLAFAAENEWLDDNWLSARERSAYQ